MEAGLRVFLLMRGAAQRLAGLLLVLGLALVAAAPARAQVPLPGGEPVIQPEVARSEIDLAAIDDEDFELGLVLGLLSIEDFGVASMQGLRLAYHVTPEFFADLSYGQADAGLTSFERLSGPVRLLSDADRRLRYYLVSLGYNILPGEAFFGAGRAFNSALYLQAGIGSTSFAGKERFTVSYGFGYRLLANDWLALHLGVRDQMFDMDLLGADQTTHNLELHGALSVFF